MQISVNHVAYKGEKSNYIEFYFYIVGSTLTQKQVDSVNSQSSVNIQIALKLDAKVVKTESFVLKSEASLDPLSISAVKKVEISNGLYDLEVKIQDENKVENAATYKSSIIVDFNHLNLRQTDPLLLSSFKADGSRGQLEKNGYALEVLPFQFYDETQNELIFYNEIYNTEKIIPADFTLSYGIEKNFAAPNEKPLVEGKKNLKSTAFIVNVMTADINRLESGSYKLVVTLRNAAEKILSQKEIFFQRQSPEKIVATESLSDDAILKEFVGQMDGVQLQTALKSIIFKVEKEEQNTISSLLSGLDLMAKRRYILTFWSKINPTLPEQAFDEYAFQMRQAEKMYGTGAGKGFETDRGRVFLQYGRPDDVILVEKNQNAPTYEIWIFNRIEKTQQENVRFLFYTPSVSTANFQLLHSTCFGEKQNASWQNDLYRNSPPANGKRRAAQLMGE